MDDFSIVFNSSPSRLIYEKLKNMALEKVTPNNPPLLPQEDAVLEYTALFSQDGTDPPTYNVMKNTLGQIAWSRFGIGIYRGTLAGAFLSGNTSVLITPGYTGDPIVVTASALDENIIQITSYKQDGATQELILADTILTGATIQIKVYNPQ